MDRSPYRKLICDVMRLLILRPCGTFSKAIFPSLVKFFKFLCIYPAPPHNWTSY